MKRFALVAEPLEPAAAEAVLRDRSLGGLVTFAGIVRDRSDDGKAVERLCYEAHAEMAEGEFRRIADEARERYGACDVAVHHRVGDLEVGDVAVVVAAASRHRSVAFEVCRYVIDEVKKRAPIWKQERYTNGGSRWKANDEPVNGT